MQARDNVSGTVKILYGEDEPSASEALKSVKAGLGPPDEVPSNTTTFEGRAVTPGQLEMACNTVPFMSGYRLIVVNGFLERFEERQPGRAPRPPQRATTARAKGKDAKEDVWTHLPALLKAMPPTTVVVFLSGKVNARNPMLSALRDGAEVRQFPLLAGPELEEWVREHVGRAGGTITAGAVRLLANFAGSDLRLLDNELLKLSSYAGSRPVDEAMVQAMTHDARQVNIFGLVDGMMHGRHAQVLKMLRQLMDPPGSRGQYVIAMLARQSRMLVIAKSLRDSGAPMTDFPAALGTTSDFVVGKVIQQARPYSMGQLKRLHERVLLADISMKNGSSTDDLALELLVMEASSILRPA